MTGKPMYEELERRVWELEQAESERKESEQNLREQHYLLDMITNTSPVAITVVNAEGRIIFANPAAEATLDLKKDDITARTYNDTAWRICGHHGEPFPKDELPFNVVRRTGRPIHDVEHAIEHPDGRRILLSINAAPLKDASDKFDGMVSALTDVTEQKQAEAALLERNKELHCLQRVRNSLDEGLSEEALFRRILEAMKEGMQYPDEAVPVILRGDERYSLDTHADNLKNGLHADIKFKGEPVGRLSVYYKDEETFMLAEEQDLVDAVSKILAHHLERTHAQEELREREERLKLALYGADLGAWDWNVQSGHVAFDERWAEMLGYKLDEIEPHVNTWEKLVHPDDMAKVMGALNVHLEGKTAYYESEHRARHKSGEWIWILDKGRVIERDAQGLPLRVCGTHLDITGRKRAEEALRESEQKWKNILVDTPQIGIALDTQANLVFANKRFLELTGWRKDEIIGRNWFDLFIPEDVRETVRNVFDAVMHAKSTQDFSSFENEIVLKSGERRTIAWSNVLSKDANGEIVDVTCLGVDLTERKQAEEALAESERRFQRMIGVVPDMISIHSPEMDIIYSNWQGFAAVPKAKQIPKTKCYKTYRGFDKICSDCQAKSVLESRKPFQKEVLLPDGTWVDLRAIPLLDEDNNVEMFMEWVRDITERKQAEEALRESESRVREKLNVLLEPEGDIGTLHLADVVDCDEIQSLMNDFHALTDIGVGIIDLEGTVLVGTGWQEVCTKFHRVHPETEKLCRESDTALASGVEPGTFKIYKCKNNMWDMVTPIMIGGKHLGNLFLGQFFFEDEAPDIATFREQAHRYGFDEDAYLKAYRAIPRWSRETVDRVMTFYINLINVISRLSYAHIKLARTTEALRESEQKFRSFVENANDIVYALDPEGRFTYVSPNWLERMGEPAENALGKSFEPYVHPDDVHLCREFLNRVLTTEKKQGSVEYRVKHRDGSWRWHVSNGSPLRNQSGTVTGYVGIGRDVTDTKRSEEALQLSELRYKSLAENFPDGALFLLDKDWCYLAANGRAFEQAGLNSRDVIGKTVKEVFPELWDVLEPNMERAFEGEKVYYEVEYRGRLYSNQAVLVDLEEGKPEQVIIITQDITERRKAETKKAELEKQYQQVQKVESIGRLAGGVAHDLNNLLSPILGYSELLRDELDSEDSRRESVDEIMSAGLRARDLVRQLLAFSRKQILEFKALDLNKVTAGLEKLLRRTIREDIEMVFKLSSDAQMVMADIGQIEQVIMNLSVNASDAMPEGGLLTIETSRVYLDRDYVKHHQSAKPGEYAMLAISDSGQGMDEATQEHIFEPFFSTKGEHGTGLGLSTVYGIVKQHGGNIWVYSESGKGTTFKIYLPVADQSKGEEKARKEVTRDLKGSETILIVEDNEQVRHLAKSVLRRNGYQVLDAENGREALEILRGHDGPVHLLLSDVVLPGMNGKELYEKAVEIRPFLRVLYMSGYTGNVIAHRGVLDEGVQFIQKPFTVHGLATKVRELLDEK